MAAPAEGLSVELAQARPIPLAATLECAAGEMLALVGPSGSGKSTILRTIAGIYTPERGRIAVGGEVWLDTATRTRRPARERSVGFVFQHYALFPHLSALDNVIQAMGHVPADQRTSGRLRTSSAPTSAGWRRAARRSSPAVSSSGSRWPGRSPAIRACCCSTSRSRRSTR